MSPHNHARKQGQGAQSQAAGGVSAPGRDPGCLAAVCHEASPSKALTLREGKEEGAEHPN